jgi:hypothetical protein
VPRAWRARCPCRPLRAVGVITLELLVLAAKTEMVLFLSVSFGNNRIGLTRVRGKKNKTNPGCIPGLILVRFQVNKTGLQRLRL